MSLLASLWLLACDPGTSVPSDSDRVLWRLPLPAGDAYAWRGVPAVAEEVAYWKTSRGVASVDLRTGALRWTAPLQIASINAPNTFVADSTVLVADWWGVAAMAVSDGRMRWAAADTTARHDTFLGAGRGILYHFVTRDLDTPPPYDAWLVARDVATGAERWRQALFRQQPFTIVPHGVRVENGSVYVSGSRSLNRTGSEKQAFVHALAAEDGAPLWQFETSGAFHAASLNATVEGDLVLLADYFSPAFFALRRTDGALAWRVNGTAGWVGPSYAPVVADGVAYGASGDRTAIALDPPTGRVRWLTRLPASARAFAVCGRYLLVEHEAVSLLDRTDGRLVATVLRSDGSSEIPTSGFAVWREVAAISTDREIVGLSCR